MKKTTDELNPQFECDRKEALVAYLYDEASTTERASFERHLLECESCNSELQAFGRVRDDLSAWQVGFAPRTELVLPRSKVEALHKLIGLFPVWARGLAMAGAAAAVVLFALSVFAANGIRSSDEVALSKQQVEALINKAVAEERASIEQRYKAEFASFKQQVAADYQTQLQTINAEHQTRLDAVKSSLRNEIRKANRQSGSYRSFFAVEGYQQEPWGDTK